MKIPQRLILHGLLVGSGGVLKKRYATLLAASGRRNPRRYWRGVAVIQAHSSDGFAERVEVGGDGRGSGVI